MTKQVMKPRRKAKLPQAPPLESAPQAHPDRGCRRRACPLLRAATRHPHARSRQPSRHGGAGKPAAEPGDRCRQARPRLRLRPRPAPHRHAFEPHHDPHKLEKHNFTAELARTLDGLCGRYDRLVVVAPPRSLGELDTLLTPQVKRMGEPSDPEGSDGRQSARLVAHAGKVLPTARAGLARLSRADRACGRCACAATSPPAA